MKEKPKPDSLEREIWRAKKHLRQLQEKKAQAEALDWDGRPIKASAFPRPYMMEPDIRTRLQIDPEFPELNPASRVLNALWLRADWETNIMLAQRVKFMDRAEEWDRTPKCKGTDFVVWDRGRAWLRYYVLVLGRGEDMVHGCGISQSLAQKLLRELERCQVIKKVGRWKTGATIYAVGFWVNPGDPMRRRAVPFPATTERKRLLKGFSLQP